jgi:hypothetical protein
MPVKLLLREEHKLQISEKKALRKIFGPERHEASDRLIQQGPL